MVAAQEAPAYVVLPGSCLEILSSFGDNSVDSIVTDPPYGLSNTDPDHVVDALTHWLAGDRTYVPDAGGGFMGKAWDSFIPPPAVWDECFRVLKPGGHLLSFAGTRTIGLMEMSIRLARFDIRDSIAWLYGSGFPKSLDVSKAIDKAAGATREVVGADRGRLIGGAGGASTNHGRGGIAYGVDAETAPATPEAEQWSGWGTALKPAFEPVIVARKPFRGTVAANVLAHGTGALNIDATRIATDDNLGGGVYSGEFRRKDHYSSTDSAPGAVPLSRLNRGIGEFVQPSGRWPANVVLDADQAAALDEQSGTLTSGALRPYKEKHENASSFRLERDKTYTSEKDSGGASRFFYVAKAPKKERPVVDGVAHPTVKPLSLMRWLVRLVTPTGGVVLDPFAGSGTTVEAALLEGFTAVGIELGGPEGSPEFHHFAMIQQRIDRALAEIAARPTPETAQEEESIPA